MSDNENEVTNEVEVEDLSAQEEIEAKELEDSGRVTEMRKTTYERKLKSAIPDEIRDLFKEQNWAVQYKPYRLANIVQNSALAELRRDGWFFVNSSELPDWYAPYFEKETFRGRDEMLVAHDLVLMKADVKLVQSQKDYYRGLAQAELDSVNTNVLEKRGFVTKGSKSSVTMSEPRFRD